MSITSEWCRYAFWAPRSPFISSDRSFTQVLNEFLGGAHRAWSLGSPNHPPQQIEHIASYPEIYGLFSYPLSDATWLIKGSPRFYHSPVISKPKILASCYSCPGGVFPNLVLLVTSTPESESSRPHIKRESFSKGVKIYSGVLFGPSGIEISIEMRGTCLSAPCSWLATQLVQLVWSLAAAWNGSRSPRPWPSFVCLR